MDNESGKNENKKALSRPYIFNPLVQCSVRIPIIKFDMYAFFDHIII